MMKDQLASKGVIFPKGDGGGYSSGEDRASESKKGKTHLLSR